MAGFIKDFGWFEGFLGRAVEEDFMEELELIEAAKHVLNLYVEGVYGQAETIRRLKQFGIRKFDIEIFLSEYFHQVQADRIRKYIVDCY